MTPFVKQLAEIIYEDAPIVASFLKVPGSAAATLVESIFSMFGVDPTKHDNVIAAIQNDPDSSKKLADLQNQVVSQMNEIAELKKNNQVGSLQSNEKDNFGISPPVEKLSAQNNNTVKVNVTLDFSKKD